MLDESMTKRSLKALIASMSDSVLVREAKKMRFIQKAAQRRADLLEREINKRKRAG